MKKSILILAAALWLLPAAAQQAEAYPSYIQLNGHAEKEVDPDEIYLSITIDEKDSRGRSSVEEQERQMVDALKRLKIDTQHDLRLADMSSEYYKRRTSLARARYRLKLTSARQVALVTDALTDIGISNVSITSVSHSQIEALRNEVRAEAIRNARDCARTLAEAIGQSIGKCVTINDFSSPARFQSNNFKANLCTGAMYDSVEEESVEREVPEFRKIRIEHDLQAKFILE